MEWEGKGKRLQAIAGETSQNVVKKCEKEELGRISHFSEVKHCDGLTELIRSATFKNKQSFLCKTGIRCEIYCHRRQEAKTD